MLAVLRLLALLPLLAPRVGVCPQPGHQSCAVWGVGRGSPLGLSFQLWLARLLRRDADIQEALGLLSELRVPRETVTFLFRQSP